MGPSDPFTRKIESGPSPCAVQLTHQYLQRTHTHLQPPLPDITLHAAIALPEIVISFLAEIVWRNCSIVAFFGAMAKVELAVDVHCRTGEGPVSYPNGTLLFVDIEGCDIHEYDTVAKKHVRALPTNGKMPGNVVPCCSSNLKNYDLIASLDVSYSLPPLTPSMIACWVMSASFVAFDRALTRYNWSRIKAEKFKKLNNVA